jgi:hypothetical protein
LLSLIFDPENGNIKFLRTSVKALLHAYLLDLHFGPTHGGIYSSKMSAKFYRPTRVHIPEVSWTLLGLEKSHESESYKYFPDPKLLQSVVCILFLIN